MIININYYFRKLCYIETLLRRITSSYRLIPKYSVRLGSLEKEEPVPYDNKVSEYGIESKSTGPVESNRLIVRISSKGDSTNSLRH